MNIKLNTLIVATLLASTTPVFAKAPNDAELNRLYHAMQVEKHFHELKNTMPTTMFEMVKQSIPEEKLNQLNAEQRQRWHNLQMDISQTTFAETFNPQLMQQIKNVWLRHAKNRFTRAEVKAATAFYRSPPGRSFLQKSTAMTPEFMQDLMPILINSQRELMNKHGQRWQNELHTIFPQETLPKAPK